MFEKGVYIWYVRRDRPSNSSGLSWRQCKTLQSLQQTKSGCIHD